MNDEDFARQAFAAAFRSGNTCEPPTLPDVEGLASQGRRAARYRHGTYAAGTTALAGVVTAGIVTGPALLGLGSTSPASVGAGGTTAAQTVPKPSATPDPKEEMPGVACPTPPAVDWTAVVAAALPASIHAVADHAVNCLSFSDGSRRIDAGFILSVPASTLQIEVQSGGQLASKLADADQLRDPTSASPSLDPSALTSEQALKSKLAEDANTRASMDAIKGSMAAKDDAAARVAKESAAASDSAAASNSVDKTAPSCQAVGANLTACVTTVTKGGYVGTDVQLIRTGANAVVIDVVAASGADIPSPAPGTNAPMDGAQVTAIAQAVAAHF